jgi:hypothetical protein
MDDILTKIRNMFSLGVQELPGYKIGDGIAMALSTTKDIDNLPETESESEDISK